MCLRWLDCKISVFMPSILIFFISFSWKRNILFSFIVILKKYFAQVCVFQLNSDNVQHDPVSALSTCSLPDLAVVAGSCTKWRLQLLSTFELSLKMNWYRLDFVYILLICILRIIVEIYTGLSCFTLNYQLVMLIFVKKKLNFTVL